MLVTIVLINVLNVPKLFLIVLNVVMSIEDHLKNVHVKMDITMMVILPLVTLVMLSVELVLVIMVVFYVLNIENNNQPLVHVKTDYMIAMLDNVVLVMLNVKLVMLNLTIV